MTSSPAVHSLLNLLVPQSKQTAENKEGLAAFKQELQAKGWAFLKNDVPGQWESNLGSKISPQKVSQLFEQMKSYCEEPQSEKEKNRITKWPENRFGYFSLPRKEGYRFITGNAMHHFQFPAAISEWKQTAEAMDRLCYLIFKENGNYLFDVDNETKSLISSIPLLTKLAGQEAAPTAPPKFGLFDIVKYHPVSEYPASVNPAEIDMSMQVLEHADPGLFSISLGSTIGNMLEMKDPTTDTWVPVPGDTLVFWCGHIASTISKDSIKPGFHKVKAHPSEARYTAWFEVSLAKQVPQEVYSDLAASSERQVSSFDDVSYLPHVNAVISMELNAIALEQQQGLLGDEEISGIPMSKSLDLGEDDMQLTLNQEITSGIPMSKSLSLEEEPVISLRSEGITGVPMSKSLSLSPQKKTAAPVSKPLSLKQEYAELTLNQEITSGIPMSKSLSLEEEQETDKITLSSEEITGVPMSKSLKPMERGEKITGIPMSKSGVETYELKLRQKEQPKSSGCNLM